MPIKNSISLKLLKKVFVIYFVITFFMTMIQISIEYYDTKNTVQEDLASLEEIYKESLQNAIWDMNIEQLESLTASISKLPFVKEVILYDASGNLLSHQTNGSIANIFSHQFNIFKDNGSQKILIAQAIISSDHSSVINIVKTGIILIVLNAMIKSILLLFLFVWAFRKNLIEPLSELTTQIEEIEFENLSKQKIRINTLPNSELDLLQRKFNTMVEKLEQQKNTILKAERDYAAKLELEVKERTYELEKTNMQLELMATTDHLTEVKNRRSFYETSEQYFLIAQRQSIPMCVLMCDIDHFKAVNDTFGHHIGDIALREFAHRCTTILRKSDILGRVGGEEFAITLLDSTIHNAKEVAEKIVHETAKIVIDNHVSFTVSIGLAQMLPGDDQFHDIIYRADKALYDAKANGRNRVVLDLSEKL